MGLVPGSACAQGIGSTLISAEHRYLFSCQGVTSDFIEKNLGEALRGLDQEMVVSIDRPNQQMKLVARFPLDTQQVIATAAQWGVTLALGRFTAEADSGLEPRE